MNLEKIVDWANQNDNILAVIMTGSHSRDDNKVDEFSDYDIELIAKDFRELADKNDWFHDFGDVIVFQAFDEGQEYPTRLVVYSDGLKVDFTLADEKRIINMKSGLNDLYQRGYKVLLDKQNLTNDLPKASGHIRKELPTEQEYLDAVNEFWFEASHIPKYLIRDELWIVKLRDWTMKQLLLKLLEWHAISLNPDQDVWHLGNHSNDWVDPEIKSELKKLFSHFEKQESWQDLLTTLDLFRRLSKSVAKNLKFQYPEKVDQKISEYILSYSNKF